ncbi:MAG: prepilin-type N-terminal cleavage/methylation domain-containing protein [Planctomycetota bacterium]|nr:prepilin-type N-terminal cleavage/methylation domain-containing protein [Planctomycetota bacterium]
MIRLHRSPRGFSLLEVMIATAILAASAMVLLSLISLGTRFGSKAEARIAGLVQAQSILDESILRMQAGETIESYTAVLPGTKPKSYRVTIEPFAMGDSTSTQALPEGSEAMLGSAASMDNRRDTSVSNGSTPAGPMPTELVSIKVELFESEGASSATAAMGATGAKGASGAKGSTGRPLVELTRLVRRPYVDQDVDQDVKQGDGRSPTPTSGSVGL